MARRRDVFWIDGYNVLLRLSSEADGSLERRRAQLAGRCAALGAKCWIVFDSWESSRPGARQRFNARVLVQYARDGLSADDVLFDRVRTTSDLDAISVVTSDRELAMKCRTHGARVLSVIDFARILQPPAPEPGPAPERPDVPLAPRDVRDWMEFLGLDGDGKEPGRS